MAVVKTPPIVDKERAELREEVGALEEQRRRIRREHMLAHGVVRKPNETNGATLEDIYRFLGNLESVLESYATDEDEIDVRRQLGEIHARLGEIGRLLDTQARM